LVSMDASLCEAFITLRMTELWEVGKLLAFAKQKGRSRERPLILLTAES